MVQEDTGLEIVLDRTDSIRGRNEITEALKGKVQSFNMGLLAPDFEVVIEETFGDIFEETRLSVYNGGFLLKDPVSESYYSFKYGDPWYKMLRSKLTELLENNPRYFLDKGK